MRVLLTLVIVILLNGTEGAGGNGPLPIVMWHGMGDTCCNPISLGSVKKLLEEVIPEVIVKSLRIGSSFWEDFESGFFVNVNDQIDEVCQQLQRDKELIGGYNGFGFSQGGLFLRGLAQRCPNPPMVNLVTLGSPHQGVFGFPKCPGANSTICDDVRRLLNFGAYSWIQKFLVQAEYWHDPLDEDSYRNKSLFLADINCEKIKKQEYKENLLRLKNFVMVMFNQDTMVQPKESELFGFYKEGQSEALYELGESQLYQEDWIGLKSLNDTGRLHLLAVDGDHLQIDVKWLTENIINPYFKS
ncbi:Palmitoyl-protein thioesterase 1 [Chamberlinius hualienensis]